MRVFNFLLYLDFINMNKKKTERRVLKVRAAIVVRGYASYKIFGRNGVKFALKKILMV